MITDITYKLREADLKLLYPALTFLQLHNFGDDSMSYSFIDSLGLCYKSYTLGYFKAVDPEWTKHLSYKYNPREELIVKNPKYKVTDSYRVKVFKAVESTLDSISTTVPDREEFISYWNMKLMYYTLGFYKNIPPEWNKALDLIRCRGIYTSSLLQDSWKVYASYFKDTDIFMISKHDTLEFPTIKTHWGEKNHDD